jgi:uncharacterized protein
MLLDLSQMRGAHDRIVREYDPAAFQVSEDDGYRVAEPVHLALDIHKDGAQYRLVGSAKTTLALGCGRCLEVFTLPVNAPFDLLYAPHTENAGEGEVEVEDDDLNTAYYHEEQIDLGQLMREQFLLSLPMKPLCTEGCRGLCPECGTNLNTGSCSCERTWTDPRLEGLRALLDKDKGNS